MILCVLKLRKFDINSLDICSPHLYTVATLRWEIQKSHFSTVLFIHTSEYLRYLRKKQTVAPLPTKPKNEARGYPTVKTASLCVPSF